MPPLTRRLLCACLPAVALVPVATTCSAACQAHGQQAIEGGTPGYQLCALVEGGINYYGESYGQRCWLLACLSLHMGMPLPDQRAI